MATSNSYSIVCFPRLAAAISILLVASTLQIGCSATLPVQDQYVGALEKIHALFQAPEVLLDNATVGRLLGATVIALDCAAQSQSSDVSCRFQDYAFENLPAPFQLNDPAGESMRGPGSYFISRNRERATLKLYVDPNKECVTQRDVETRFDERLLEILPFSAPASNNIAGSSLLKQGQATGLPSGNIPSRYISYVYRKKNGQFLVQFCANERRCMCEMTIRYDISIEPHRYRLPLLN